MRFLPIGLLVALVICQIRPAMAQDYFSWSLRREKIIELSPSELVSPLEQIPPARILPNGHIVPMPQDKENNNRLVIEHEKKLRDKYEGKKVVFSAARITQVIAGRTLYEVPLKPLLRGAEQPGTKWITIAADVDHRIVYGSEPWHFRYPRKDQPKNPLRASEKPDREMPLIPDFTIRLRDNDRSQDDELTESLKGRIVTLAGTVKFDRSDNCVLLWLIEAREK